jgi:hypothetical protein
VGRLNGLERAEFLFPAPEFPVSLGCIGFSFSRAITRYDQRKSLEDTEANAIAAEYVRVDFLSAVDAARVRALLRKCLDQRILFYGTRDDRQLGQIDAATAQLEADLWSAVQVPAGGAADTRGRPCRHGYGRRIELQRTHAGRLVESNSNGGMGSDGSNRYLLQSLNRLWRAPR